MKTIISGLCMGFVLIVCPLLFLFSCLLSNPAPLYEFMAVGAVVAMFIRVPCI